MGNKGRGRWTMAAVAAAILLGGTAPGQSCRSNSTRPCVIQLAASDYNGAAVLANGTLMTWGVNNGGQLGNGTKDPTPDTHPTPGPVRTLSGVTQAALSTDSALAIGSPTPKIPSVIDQSQAEAAQMLQAAGYVLGRVSVVVDITCEFLGVVKTQTPAAGTLDPPGTAVSVTIGKAGGKCLP